MRVTSLRLTGFRVIEAAEFQFQPGFNLVVGVNGVGKTSVLDALGVCLSAFVKHANKLRMPAGAFALEDIRIGADALGVECYVQIGSIEHRYLIHKPREDSAPRKKRAGMPREQVHHTPGKASFLGRVPMPVTGREPGGRPLAVLFSTNRAVPSERAPAKSVAAGGTAAAFADAFANRGLQLGELAAWMRVQETLRSEHPLAGRALAGFEKAVSEFLPGYSRVDDWRGGGRRMGVAVSGGFRNAGASLPAVAPFPVAAHRTGRAVFPHPALGRDHAFAHGKLVVRGPRCVSP